MFGVEFQDRTGETGEYSRIIDTDIVYREKESNTYRKIPLIMTWNTKMQRKNAKDEKMEEDDYY